MQKYPQKQKYLRELKKEFLDEDSMLNLIDFMVGEFKTIVMDDYTIEELESSVGMDTSEYLNSLKNITENFLGKVNTLINMQ